MCFPFGGSFVRLKRSCKRCGFVADQAIIMSLNSLRVSHYWTYYSRASKKLCFDEYSSTALVILVLILGLQRTHYELSSYVRTFPRVLTASDLLSIQRWNAFPGFKMSILALSKSRTKESSCFQDAVDISVPVLEDLGFRVCDVACTYALGNVTLAKFGAISRSNMVLPCC